MASDLRSELPSESSTEPSEEAGSNAAEASAERIDLGLVPAPEVGETATEPTEPSGEAQSESPAQADSAPEETTEGRGVPVWLVLVGVVIAALIVGYQMRLNGQLAAEVTGLEAELSRTQSVLGAHKTHLTEIRGGVRDLSDRLQSLQSLVETEPVVARDARSDR